MRSSSGIGGLVLALVASASVVLSGCGGGGGGGGDGGGGSEVLLLITAQGVGVPLWQNVGGNPTPPPVCPDGVFVNSTIAFTFGGPVAASSLPLTGIAIGSINIIDLSTGQAAQGTFTVTDDPAFSAGNQRRVLFSPTPPGNPNDTCAAGLQPQKTYQISVPKGGSSPQVVIVDGSPLSNDATTCFLTCGCPSPGNCTSSFTDPIAGPPYVIMTSPTTSSPPPAPIDPALITNNTIQMLISEALNPAGINLANVRVVNSATQAQVPGTIQFFQAGSIPGLGVNSRIDYIASGPLLGSVIYQILLSSSVVDFGGNPIQTSLSNPGQPLLFQTVPVTFCPQPPLVETFDTTQNRDIVTGAIRWAGDGVLQTEFPLELTGTGADGPFAPMAGSTTVLDTNEMIGMQSRQGIWNFTSINIPATATVRIVGPYFAHLRCTGTANVDGIINASAGTTNPATNPPVYERGPEQGVANNGSPGTNCEAIGGAANCGGGIGGTGSGITPPPGSPTTFQCTVRVAAGENGYGPTLGGGLNPGSPANTSYAGGQGGDSGCFPVPSPLPAFCATGELGGFGGAGGTAGRVGEVAFPRGTVATIPGCTTNPACDILMATCFTQTPAQPSQVPIVMVPPITLQSAGSGGGGGGDHLENINPAPNGDDQGGGGGGGGGGVRISSVGDYTQGATGQITSNGAQGATAQTLGGGGGSGSGGQVWIQSFATLTMNPAAIISVDGPGRLGPVAGQIGCSNQAAGGGGDGFVQLEAGQGPTPTPNFQLLPVPTPTTGAVFSAPPFQFAGGVVGQASSKFRFTGYGAPDYSSVVELVNPGNAAGATLSIRYEGAQEAVNSTPQSPVFDPNTTKTMATGGGPITASNIDELDGYAFVRFVVNVTYPAPPATPSNAILPSVKTITINFSAAVNCP